MNAREIALKTVYSVEFEGAYSNMALKSALARNDLSAADRGLVTNIVYGTVSRKLTLDYVITAYSKIKLKKISKYILIILRIGLYQLMYMDKIPESAAVNESVKLAKRYGHGASAGFVNGVLRSYIRNGIEIPENDLSVKYSFPQSLCNDWVASFGFEFTEKLMSAMNTEPKLTIRPNTLKTTSEELLKLLSEKGVKSEACGISLVCGGYDVARDELYRDGYYTVQDAAASAAALELAPEAGETVIDMCSAPGGKTTHMAELMKNKGEILAFDVHEHKIKLIEENAKRLGIDIIKAKIGDGTVFDKSLEKTADRVLCDVPCSGLGIIRRKPDIKWNKEDMGGLYEIQRKILENGAYYLKNGGMLLYSTCTIDRRENEDITSEFLINHSDFSILFEKTYYPHIDNTDGFYICKMRKL
ncbi:MAG: 16S rRNA (cytosine(967)-C(5))-methyltransferase RsmB [Oscillospiraceae bacterium]|nr:16S rRNA (cytosine(967)-C(5))-methyltransferase RsmB [Oscillospiraceae bacterium]